MKEIQEIINDLDFDNMTMGNLRKINEVLAKLIEYENKEIVIRALTNMTIEELIEAIKNGKVVV